MNTQTANTEISVLQAQMVELEKHLLMATEEMEDSLLDELAAMEARIEFLNS